MERTLAVFSYNLALALWIGGIAVFTFVVTPAIFGAYDRDTAGQIVGKLFDGYFLYNLALSAVALALVFAAWPDRATAAFKSSLALIVLAVAINLFITFKLHPDVKEVKRQVASFETTSRDDPLRIRFSKLHAASAVLNLVLLADGAVLLFLSASRPGR